MWGMLGRPQLAWTFFDQAADACPNEGRFVDAHLVAASWLHRLALLDTPEEVRVETKEACLGWIDELSCEPLSVAEAVKE